MGTHGPFWILWARRDKTFRETYQTENREYYLMKIKVYNNAGNGYNLLACLIVVRVQLFTTSP